MRNSKPKLRVNIEHGLAAHAGVIEVEQLLYPIGAAMAGDSAIDPFKD